MAVHVITPESNELDISTAVALREVLASIPVSDHIVVDLAPVTFCDSTGMGTIVEAWRRQSEGGGSLVITNLAEPLARWFSATGLLDVLMPTRR